MYCGSKPNAPHGTVTKSDQPSPPPVIRSMNVRPPQTDAHDTKLSRNFATILASPLAVRSLFGSFLVSGRKARRRSERPPPEVLAGGCPKRDSRRAASGLMLGRRDGRNGGALRDSSARRSASAVGQRASGSFSSERITHEARSSGQVGVRS